jgi:hypothetical protein
MSKIARGCGCFIRRHSGACARHILCCVHETFSNVCLAWLHAVFGELIRASGEACWSNMPEWKRIESDVLPLIVLMIHQ